MTISELQALLELVKSYNGDVPVNIRSYMRRRRFTHDMVSVQKINGKKRLVLEPSGTIGGNL